MTPAQRNMVEKAAQHTTDTPEKIARTHGLDVVAVRRIVAVVRK